MISTLPFLLFVDGPTYSTPLLYHKLLFSDILSATNARNICNNELCTPIGLRIQSINS